MDPYSSHNQHLPAAGEPPPSYTFAYGTASSGTGGGQPPPSYLMEEPPVHPSEAPQVGTTNQSSAQESSQISPLHPTFGGQTVNITVKTLTGKTYSVPINLQQDVYLVKLEIQRVSEIPPDQQQLIFAGTRLYDGQPIGAYKVQEGATLHLVLGTVRLGGANQNSKVQQPVRSQPPYEIASGQGGSHGQGIGTVQTSPLYTPSSSRLGGAKQNSDEQQPVRPSATRIGMVACCMIQ
eukprot:gb/GECG01006869.1/.p1 GENE.gb/GECG01006869.1/~~gb/GECG01006869.1/.p1  ORF type:complete len:236 (+),score=21.15 gb/GECG01006869.1/:1-708(+)